MTNSLRTPVAHRRHFLSGLRLGTWLVFVAMSVPSVVRAQSSSASPDKQNGNNTQPKNSIELNSIREVPLPIQEISPLLNADWKAVKLSRYRGLLTKARAKNNGPKTTWIDRADYFAVLNGSALDAGRVVFQVKHLSGKPEFLDFESLNLAVSHLEWKQRRAIWGTMEDNRVVVRVDRPSGSLEGNWSLEGRPIGQRIDFDLRLPPATVSKILLQTPIDWRFESSHGQVTGPFPTSTPGWTVWQVDLGSESRCRLTARRFRIIKQKTPVVLVQTDVTHVIQRERTQVQARVSLDISGAPSPSVSFQIPRDLNVLSVRYGTDLKLAHQIRRSKSGQTLRILFPEPLIGKPRPLTIEGAITRRVQSSLELPGILPLSGVFLEGDVHVRIVSPLSVQSLRLSGLRQSSPLATSPQGETLSFHQWHPHARLQIQLDLPRPVLSSRMATHLDLTEEQWKSTSEIQWNVQNGSLFTLESRLLPGWKVSDVLVRRASPQSNEKVPANWTLKQGQNGQRYLVIDLPDALTPSSPVTTTITSIRPKGFRGRRLAFPTVIPQKCEIVSQVSGIRQRTPASPLQVFSKNSAWTLIPTTEIPNFVREMTLFEQMQSDGDSLVRFLSCRSTSDPGFLSLSGENTAFDARSWTVISIRDNQLLEHSAITVKQTGLPIDRLTVYLGSQSGQVTWNVPATDDPRFQAVRIPSNRHSDWNLPATGELWEIRFNSPRTRPFQIILDRKLEFSGPVRAGLPFLPNAGNFLGTVEMEPHSSASATPKFTDFQTVVDLSSEFKYRPLAHVPKSFPKQLWNYRTPSSELQIVPHRKKLTLNHVPAASFQLLSVLSPSRGQSVHIGTFRFTPTTTNRFEFSLQENAELVLVKLNGQILQPKDTKGAYSVSPLPANQNHELAIHYRTPSPTESLRSLHNVVIPRTKATITGFQWTFALPPNLDLASHPSFGTLTTALRKPSWTQRFFGPLGRPSDEPVFNPFMQETWQKFTENSPDSKASQKENQLAFAPPGWKIFRLASGAIPEEIPQLDVWNQKRARQISWVVLLTCLGVGLMLRMKRISRRGKIAAIWIAGCAVSAWFVPRIYSEIIGSGLIGAILAALVPRHLLFGNPQSLQNMEPIPQGSTTSYPNTAVTLLLIAFGSSLFAFSQSVAEETQPELSDSSARTETLDSVRKSAKVTPRLTKETVIVPVASSLENKPAVPLVYIHKELLAHLEQRAASNHPAPAYLIRNAEYQAVLAENDSVTLDAKLQVDVLSSQFPAQIHLPFSNLELAGVNACRVNQRVTPVRRSENKPGFLIDLPQPAQKFNSSKAARNAVAMSFPAGFGSAMASSLKPSNTVSTYQIEFKFYVPTEIESSRHRMRVQIPSVPASHFELKFEKPYTSLQIEDQQGRFHHRSFKGQTIKVNLGRSHEFIASWSYVKQPKTGPAEVAVDSLQLIDVQPTFLEYRFRVHYEVLRGRVASLGWRLPRRVVIRKLQIENQPDGIESFRLIPDNNGHSQLHMEFSEPQQKTFLVDCTFLVPHPMPSLAKNVSAKEWSIQVPVIAPFSESHVGSSSGSQALLKSVSQKVGIQPGAGFHLEPVTKKNKGLTKVDADDFKSSPIGTTDFKMPDLRFQHESAEIFHAKLKLLAPKRRVRQTETVRLQSDILLWTYHAELETTVSPAMRHQLKIDPKMIIEKVTVEQDEAPRLARWTRRGNRLILFLSNTTTKPKTVTVVAKLPFRGTGTIRSPGIRFENAVAEKSDLHLYHRGNLHLGVKDLHLTEPLEFTPSIPASQKPGSNQSVNNSEDIFVGAYRLNDPAGPLPALVIRRLKTDRSAEIFTQIQQAQGKKWSLSTTVHFSDLVGTKPNLQIQIPREFVESLTIHPRSLRTSLVRNSDGSATVTARPADIRQTNSQITFQATISPPSRQKRWRLPGFSVLNCTIQQSFLLLPNASSSFNWTTSETPIPVSEAPQWLQQKLASETTTASRLFQQSEATWQLQHLKNHSSDPQTNIPLMETKTWFSTGQQEWGQTKIILLNVSKKSLEILIPEDLSIRTVLVNGDSLENRNLSNGILRIPFSSIRPVNDIVIHWNRNNSSSWLPVRHRSHGFPHPHHVPIRTSLFIAAKSPDQLVYQPTGVDPLSVIEYRIHQLEGLMEACEAEDLLNNSRPWLWETVRKAYADLKQQQHSTLQRASSSHFIEIKERIQTLDDRFATLKKRFELLPIPTTESRSLDSAFENNFLNSKSGLVMGRWSQPEDGSDIGFWSINQTALRWIAGICTFLLFWPIVRRIIKLETGELLSIWDPISWAALGIIWWICLTPSFLGMILVFASAVRALMRKRQISREASTVQLSG
ncbi:MAG: hypothetical protein Tsb009_17570 [Planctomycetaceae bacterium]